MGYFGVYRANHILYATKLSVSLDGESFAPFVLLQTPKFCIFFQIVMIPFFSGGAPPAGGNQGGRSWSAGTHYISFAFILAYS